MESAERVNLQRAVVAGSRPTASRQYARALHSSPQRGGSPALKSAPGAAVCVTGATGFIALHLVEQLLSAGYRVRAAVRSDDPAKLAPLQALAPLGDLEVVSGCDLMVEGSFDAAVADVDVCFHTYNYCHRRTPPRRLRERSVC